MGDRWIVKTDVSQGFNSRAGNPPEGGGFPDSIQTWRDLIQTPFIRLTYPGRSFFRRSTNRGTRPHRRRPDRSARHIPHLPSSARTLRRIAESLKSPRPRHRRSRRQGVAARHVTRHPTAESYIVVTGACQGRPIRRKRHRTDRIGMSCEGANILSRGDVPQPHPLERAAGCQRRPIGRKRHRPEIIAML